MIKITPATNFVRVFRLPNDYPEDFCFGGGHAVQMQLVDWFNPHCDSLGIPDQYEFGSDDHKKHIRLLRDEIRSKRYFDPRFTYLLLMDYGDSVIVNPELRFNDLNAQMKAMQDSYETKEDLN